MDAASSRRWFNVLLTAVMLLSLLTGAVSAAQPDPNLSFEQAEATVAPVGRVIEPKDAEGPAVYIVQLAGDPLVTYQGDIEGLPATNPRSRGATKFDATSAESVAYTSYLDGRLSEALSQASSALGRQVKPVYEYRVVLNGYAAEMTPEEAAQVAVLPNVTVVEREIQYELQTDVGPQWMNADAIWDGLEGISATKGEGVIVGVIDTGIDPWNPSFADVGGDGYDHTNPRGQYYGVCDPENTDPPTGITAYDPSFPCNDKLIGAWGYASVNGGTPRDSDGHGSHTASTAAGNVVIDAVLEAPTGVYTASISGVAPHANVIAYAACCTGAALAAAQEQIVLDGVDVVNYSIGASSLTANPWSSANAVAWLNAREAGVFVATSAGNNGPGLGTVGSPADLPWMLSVGANSHDRAFRSSVDLDDGTNQLTLNGMALSAGYGPAPVVFAADYAETLGIDPDDARLCGSGVPDGNGIGIMPFPAGTFNGEIVVCERGLYARVFKGASALAGGAGGFILAQPDEFTGGPGSVTADTHDLPASHIDYYEYQKLNDFVANAAGPVQGTISGAMRDQAPANGDIMASFSSRGPNGNALSDIIIPNVTAPGRAIWAAYHQGDAGDGSYTYNVIQGTSMSSPHVAGAGALMRALYPNWSVSEISSALMLTARDTVINDDGTNAATPFAQGAGHVDLQAAAKTGMVMDVTVDDFIASNPEQGGQPRGLNLPSLGNAQCVSICTWTRTVKSTQDTDIDYVTAGEIVSGTVTVEPASFTLAAGGEQQLTITVALADDAILEEWTFGKVTISPATDDTDLPDAHLPVAVALSRGDIPNDISIDTARNAGSYSVSGLQIAATDDLTVNVVGAASPELNEFTLYEDPTKDIPEGFYDDLSQIYWRTIDVPAGSYAVVAEVLSTTSPDLDMAVGFDTNGNGQPDADEQICQSAGPSWDEFCWVDNPQAGTWWVIVLNWDESANAPDPITLATAVVPNSANGNLWVDAPTSVTNPDEPFDIRVYWNEDMTAGDKLYGAIMFGTGADNPGNIGTVPVYISRVADDVRKEAILDGFPAPKAGETVDYVIVIDPNIMPEDLSYVLTDVIPAGMTYVVDSVSASAGTVAVADGVLTWSGVQAVPGREYVMSTSLDNPSCAMPLAGADGVEDAYVDLEAFGFGADSTVSGNGVVFQDQWDGGPFVFFNGLAGDTLFFTDDGFMSLDEASVAGIPYANVAIPDAGLPNSLLAPIWHDMEIVYEEGEGESNRGVTTGIRLTSGGVPSAKLLEFDDIQMVGDPDSQIDYEVMIRNAVIDAPGAFEIVFAYDNLTGAFENLTVGTVGIENTDGTAGVQYAYNDAALATLQSGMAICFDWVQTGAPVVITYQVTVDEGVADFTEIVNEVEHTVTSVGFGTDTSSHTFTVGSRPIIETNPTAIDMALELGKNQIVTFDINNLGSEILNWTIDEEEGGVGAAAVGSANLVERAAKSQSIAPAISATGDKVYNPATARQAQSPAAVDAANAVQDPSFEAGTPNPVWSEGSVNFDTPLCDPDSCSAPWASEGAWYVWFGGIDEAETGFVTQTVTIPAENTVLAFDFWAGACDSADDFMQVTLDGVEVFRADGDSALCGDSWYTRQRVDISDYADGGEHVLEFRSETFATNGDNSNFLVDRVGVVEPAQELMDGSFEAGSPNTYWYEFSTNGGSPICSADTCGADVANDGAYYVWFGGWDAYELASVAQDIIIPADIDQLAFDLWLASCAGPDDYLWVGIDGYTVARYETTSAQCESGYNRQTIDISAYADGGVHTLEFSSEVFGTADSWSNFFLDNVALETAPPPACVVGNVSWARNVTPREGATAAGESSQVSFILDASGLDLSVYTGNLCINSNDPENSLIKIPLQLIVGYAPMAKDAAFSVAENSETGTAVGTVMATDFNDVLTYAIASGNDDGAFAIDTASGEITVADGSKLDYESETSRSLMFKATDSAGLSDMAMVTIDITNVIEAPTVGVSASPAQVAVGGDTTVTVMLHEDNGSPVAAQTVFLTDGIFMADLSGANEVPPVETDAMGKAMFQLNPATGQVNYTLDVTGLGNVRAAHIHIGPAGANGPAAIWLYDATGEKAPDGDFPVTKSVVLPPDLLLAALTEGLYVNVHTDDHPSGEIRGQIVGAKALVTDGDGMASTAMTSHTGGVKTIYAITVIDGEAYAGFTAVQFVYVNYLIDMFK